MLKGSSLSAAIFLITFMTNSELYSQSQAMYYLKYPRSMMGLGMGENTVALRSSEDALTFNPANLVFIERPTVSFFHQPFQMLSNYFGIKYPLNSYSALFKLEHIGSFGIEYIDWDWGEKKYFIFDGSRMIQRTSHIYERSFSVGYAREFFENFSAGIQLRYAKSSLGAFATAEEFITSAEKLFGSAGLNYSPQFLENKLNIGFSLTNFGTKVWYKDEAQSDPPPSQLNLGIGFHPIDNDFFSLQTQLAISKPFDERPAKSSFKSLFSDWKDFPNDATLHTGIAFNWKPLDLGNGFAFFQEFYFGNYSAGNKAWLNNFYTHGGKVGIEFSGIQFSAGYAGRWHNVYYSIYVPWEFPYETVQFSLGVNEKVLSNKYQEKEGNSKPHSIVVSLGLGKSFRIGSFSKGFFFPEFNVNEEFKDDLYFSLEGAFYLDEKSAIITGFSYSPTDLYANFYDYYQIRHMKISKVEIFSMSSSYRYHPLEIFSPLYVQGGLSITRLNPTSDYFYPKYDYKTSLLLSLGANIEVYEAIILCPFINYNMLLSRSGSSVPRLGAFNQFDLGVKVGYKF